MVYACRRWGLFLSLMILAPQGLVAEDNVTVKERVDQIGAGVRQRLKPWFARQRVEYPPERLVMAVFKEENRLKIYAPGPGAAGNDWRFIMQYEVAKLSGNPGPKLRNGDKQVPEGVYEITYLHPESKYWLSLGLNYPNAFDRARAREDGRRKLGGDIMIHGWWFSTGCVAVGNTAAEDLFVLAHDVGRENVDVIISPVDFRTSPLLEANLPKKPAWTRELYAELERELDRLGSEGLSTETRLISYADIAPPPPTPKSFLQELMDALVEAAETSASKAIKKDDAASKNKD